MSVKLETYMCISSNICFMWAWACSSSISANRWLSVQACGPLLSWCVPTLGAFGQDAPCPTGGLYAKRGNWCLAHPAGCNRSVQQVWL